MQLKLGIQYYMKKKILKLGICKVKSVQKSGRDIEGWRLTGGTLKIRE